jgi:hypothetical protein
LRFEGTSIANLTPAISMPRNFDLPIIPPRFQASNRGGTWFSHRIDVHLIGNPGVPFTPLHLHHKNLEMSAGLLP